MRGLTRILLLTLTAASAVAVAGDPQSPQAPTAPPPVAQPTPGAAPSPLPTPAADIQDFVPTEKVSADDAVAFPTDI
jgi:hypothetical protein